MKREIPFELPAGASEELECVLETARAGKFESQIHLYFDDFGLRKQVMSVRGEASAGKGE